MMGESSVEKSLECNHKALPTSSPAHPRQSDDEVIMKDESKIGTRTLCFPCYSQA